MILSTMTIKGWTESDKFSPEYIDSESSGRHAQESLQAFVRLRLNGCQLQGARGEQPGHQPVKVFRFYRHRSPT